MAEQIDFVNVGLKSLQDRFYQEMCHVPSVAPVLRNIRLLYEHGVHLEITTPITAETSGEEIRRMAQFISRLSPDIPWHLYRLLPEYKMSAAEHTPMGELLGLYRIAKEYLNHVYVGNLVGSEWLDTICPDCAAVLVKRINTLGCGCKVMACHIQDKKCPQCGRPSPITGDCTPLPDCAAGENSCSIGLAPETNEPCLGLLEAQGFRKTFDFRTGDALACAAPMVNTIASIMSRHPYPGDEKPASDNWVTQMALELQAVYPSDLVMLDYAQALFMATNQEADYQPALKNIFNDIDSFLAKTGYEPLIIGLGGLEEIKQNIDIETILGPSPGMLRNDGKYVYINQELMAKASAAQLGQLKPLCRIISRREFLGSLQDSYSDAFAASLDDYVAIANPGIVFQGINSMGRKRYRTTSLCESIPVYSAFEAPQDISEIAAVVGRAVTQGKKVALIIVEGAGAKDFPFPVRQCANKRGEFVYQLHQQYITLGSGIPYYRLPFVFGNRSWAKETNLYPFSGKFYGALSHALGRLDESHRCFSVGNRNIFTHVCLEADISLECYCCFQHNYGILSVFRNKALSQNTH